MIYVLQNSYMNKIYKGDKRRHNQGRPLKGKEPRIHFSARLDADLYRALKNYARYFNSTTEALESILQKALLD